MESCYSIYKGQFKLGFRHGKGAEEWYEGSVDEDEILGVQLGGAVGGQNVQKGPLPGS